MYDTIAITLNQDQFEVVDHNRFTPSTYNLFNPPYLYITNGKYIKCVSNPTKADKEAYSYLPRLTLIKSIRNGGYAIGLRIEFSIPKILYGDNFQEATVKDFDRLVYKIQALTWILGVKITNLSSIHFAKVSSIHFSKNIILIDGTKPSYFIDEFRKVNINKIYDTNQSDYRNDGHSFKYRSNTFAVIFYDKMIDLNRAKISEKRAEEKDTYCQMDLFKGCKPEAKKPFEVLRIEARVGNRVKLKSLLKKINQEDLPMTFKAIYESTISKQILLQTLKHIEDSYPKTQKQEYTKDFKDYLYSLSVKNTDAKPKDILLYIGIQHAVEQMGERNLKDFVNQYGKHYWYILKKKIEYIRTNKPIEIFKFIRHNLEEFKTVTKKDLPICNRT